MPLINIRPYICNSNATLQLDTINILFRQHLTHYQIATILICTFHIMTCVNVHDHNLGIKILKIGIQITYLVI